MPGTGVVHAQARFNQAARDQAVALLAGGTAPAEVIAAITSAEFDADAATRQYGVVDLAGRVAGYTGSGTTAYAGDRQGSAGSYVYSVQGNILTSARVVDQAAAAFESGGCDLAARLLAALRAGAEGGEGDSRCTESRGIPSDSAFLEVDREGEPAGTYAALRVPTSGDADPLVSLAAAYDTFREAHPCPSNGAAGSAGNAGSSGNEAGGSGVGSGSKGAPPSAEPAGGCGCRTAVTPRPTGRAAAWLACVALALRARRRWNRHALRC